MASTYYYQGAVSRREVEIVMKNNNLPQNFPFVLCGRLYKCKHEYLPEHVATDRNLVVLLNTLFLVNEDPEFEFLSCVEDDLIHFNSSTLCLHDYPSLRQCGIAWIRRQNNKWREICIGFKESKRLLGKERKLFNKWLGSAKKVWTSHEMRMRENDPTLKGTADNTASHQEKLEIAVKKIAEKEKEIVDKKNLPKEKKLQKKWM